MKKRLLLLLIIVSSTIANSFAKWVVVNRLRLNGDGSGKYDAITRTSEDALNAGGVVVGTTINIGCTGPGTNACPLFRAVGGGPISGVDESVANYMEQRMLEIENLVVAGTLNSNDTFIIALTMSDGTIKQFRVKENWNCNTLGNGEIKIEIEEANS